MSIQPKAKPQFRTEDEEREFWANHSPLDYFNVASARRASFPNLRPTLRSISIRLPADMLDDLKILANKRDVPYQSLAKLYLAWGISADRRAIKPGRHPIPQTRRNGRRRFPAKDRSGAR